METARAPRLHALPGRYDAAWCVCTTAVMLQLCSLCSTRGLLLSSWGGGFVLGLGLCSPYLFNHHCEHFGWAWSCGRGRGWVFPSRGAPSRPSLARSVGIRVSLCAARARAVNLTSRHSHHSQDPTLTVRPNPARSSEPQSIMVIYQGLLNYFGYYTDYIRDSFSRARNWIFCQNVKSRGGCQCTMTTRTDTRVFFLFFPSFLLSCKRELCVPIECP